MVTRVTTSGLSIATVDGVFLLHYSDTITIERARIAQDDYVACCATTGGAMPMLMIVDRPLPMPTSEVRRHWRAAARREPGFGSIALVARPLNSLMISAASHLAQQLVAVLGVTIQIFGIREQACRWLSEHAERELDAERLDAAADELEALSRTSLRNP